MQVFLAGALALLGIVLIVAGAKGNGTALFSSITGVGIGGGSGGAPAAYTPAPGSPAGQVMPALGPTGPGTTGPVIFA